MQAPFPAQPLLHDGGVKNVRIKLSLVGHWSTNPRHWTRGVAPEPGRTYDNFLLPEVIVITIGRPDGRENFVAIVSPNAEIAAVPAAATRDHGLSAIDATGLVLYGASRKNREEQE